MLSRLLWEESTFNLRRFVPVVFHAIVHPRLVLVEKPWNSCPSALFSQPDLAVYGILLVGSGVEMRRLDAAAPVAQVENDLAFRNVPSAHFIGDAVGFGGFAFQLQSPIAVRIQPMPPDEALATEGYRVICWRSVDGGIIGLVDGASASSVGYARICQVKEECSFGVVLVHGVCLP